MHGPLANCWKARKPNMSCLWAYPFKPSRSIKASFYIPENRLNIPTTKGFLMKIFMKLICQYMVISLIFHSLQIIFIHYKSRIVTAIRGL